MSVHLNIKNFRVIRSAEIVDDQPVSLVIGNNEDGKSTLAQALKFALTREAYGFKGEAVRHLVSHGESQLSVKLYLPGAGLTFEQWTSRGDTLKSVSETLHVPKEVLPLVLDAAFASDVTGGAMKAFLAGVGANKFDPVAHFANDTAVRYHLGLAMEAGKSTTKQFVAWFEEQRAACTVPPAPVAPAVPRPTPEELSRLQKVLDHQTGLASQAKAQREANDLRLADLDRATSYRAAYQAYELELAKPVAGDTLGALRQPLLRLSSINSASLAAMQEIVVAAGYDSCHLQMAQTALQQAQADATQRLAAAPLPKAPPAPPAAPTAAVQALLTQYTPAALAEEVAAQLAKRPTLQALERDLNATQQVAAQALAQANKAVGAWEAYTTAHADHEPAVTAARERWGAWDRSAKSVKNAEMEFNQSQGTTFSALVTAMAEPVLQGRSLTVDPEQGIMLGAEPFQATSGSTQWRIQAVIMAAVALTCRSPILMLDGADILTAENRSDFMKFVCEHLAPRFQHTLVTAALRGKAEDERPSTVPGLTKWLVTRGQFTRI